jgi:hypothetical protein
MQKDPHHFGKLKVVGAVDQEPGRNQIYTVFLKSQFHKSSIKIVLKYNQSLLLDSSTKIELYSVGANIR